MGEWASCGRRAPPPRRPRVGAGPGASRGLPGPQSAVQSAGLVTSTGLEPEIKDANEPAWVDE